MKFSCSKKELSEAINNTLPAVSQKSTLVALEGLLMECKENKLTVTGYNLELGITKSIDVKTEELGKIVLNASLLANIVNKMPDGEITFSSDEKLLTVISCNEIEFTILGLDAGEFPDMPSIGGEKAFKIPGHLLRSMISQTLFSVAQNDQNPSLTGSLFDVKNSVLHIVSVDGVRLAMRREQVHIEGEFQFIVPGKTLSEILKLLSRFSSEDEEAAVSIFVTNKHILFSVCGYLILSRLLDGNFLDYESAIPKDVQTTVTVETKLFMDSVNRAAIIINERAKSPVRCVFGDNRVYLSCETSVGKINDQINAQIDGPEVKIGFNNKYMTDALKASDCETLKIEMNGPLSPIKIIPIDGDEFLFLVLPVRLKD